MPLFFENFKYEKSHDEAQYLSGAEIAAVIAQLDQLPMKQQLCHGDPNPGNILLREHDTFIIDWNNASTGNPKSDLAEYIIMIRCAILSPHLRHEATVSLYATREASIRIFMEEYEKLSGIAYADIEPWIAPVAARKLIAEAISEAEKTMLVDEIRRRLHTRLS
ncbi:DUF1679 domain-containing protein [Paenibacillus amylolyticus]|uniref:phosphotransferase family protein n=1 Tax=Paenibacillus amylolyticus TaxID=1451 RepID=UPI00105A12D0|nr:phosphotransferase [Paenibacillus amylolyticus]TDL65513.1 DUF1679 domain-containing protein [Paenibacillus amylolyticus]